MKLQNNSDILGKKLMKLFEDYWNIFHIPTVHLDIINVFYF